MDYSVQLNQARCLVEKESFGATIVTNVCTGNVIEVPWQIGDYANAIGITLVAFFTIFILAAAVIVPVWMWFTGRI